jgi:hypothetical protein
MFLEKTFWMLRYSKPAAALISMDVLKTYLAGYT